MTLPDSGPISASMINEELEKDSTAIFYLTSQECRDLAGIETGSIKFSDFYGKSLVSIIKPLLVHPDSSEKWEFLYLQGSQFEMDGSLEKHVKTKVEIEKDGSLIWDWEKEDEFDPGYFDGEEQAIIDNTNSEDFEIIDSTSSEDLYYLEIEYNLDRNPYLISYKIHVNDESNAPYSWKIKGKNTDTTWVTLDQQDEITDWDTSESKQFILDNVSGTGYKYYKFESTENNGGDTIEIEELIFETHTEPNDLEWIEGDDVEDSLQSSLEYDTTYDVRIGYASENDPDNYTWGDWESITTVSE